MALDTRWKSVERAVARALGGQRVPITGRARGSAPDVSHERFSIEIKTRKSLPAWIMDATQQARASRRGGQIAIVVLHQKGQRVLDSWVMMAMSDLLEVTGAHGEVPDVTEPVDDA